MVHEFLDADVGLRTRLEVLDAVAFGELLPLVDRHLALRLGQV